MGNSVSRPSCLGEKSPRPEDLLKEPSSATLNKEEDGAGSPEKVCLSPQVIENGWNVALEGAAKSSPLPKQNNLDLKLRNCCPLQTQKEGAVAPWTSPKSLGASWDWKLRTSREVTEVTEVTETVVTEIVEVTEYPGGDKVTRMVKVLADVREALPQAAALPGGMQGAGLTLETAGKLGAWVSEVEALMGHQKPPSGEAKVVKAQLQEQKLLLRLLEERIPHIGCLCHPLSAEPAGAAEGLEQPRGLASLQEKWAILVQEAEARHSCLQQIVPAASVFQELVEAFQDWLSLTEQKLAQLWGAPGSLAQSQDAHQQIQDLRREVQSKPAELEEVLECGRRLLEMVPGEEGRLVQGKMDSLQLRLLLVDQRSSDTLQRMEQILEASSRLDPAQEDLGLRLQPPEKEQRLPGSQAGDGPCPLPPAGREKRLSAETLRHQDLVERPVAVADPLLSLCPTDLQEGLQLLVTALQEGMESLGQQSPACTLQLAQGQLLLAQHAEVQAELSQWLEEAQQAVVAFSPGSSIISCDAFWEQQEALEGLREAIAEQKPLMGKRITTWLAELRPREVVLLWQRLQTAKERYGSLREQAQQAAVILWEVLPQYSQQLSEQLELVAGSLEWLQDCKRHPLALRGDPVWLREQLWENSLRLAELEKMALALETLLEQGAELQATLQSTAHPVIQEHMQDLRSQWQLLWQLEKDREASLQELLALAALFWRGLAKLAGALSNTQRIVLDLEDTVASSPKDIQAKLVAMQVLRKDVLSQTMTMQAIQEAGWCLPSDGSGACADALQGSLQQISHRWSQVLTKTEHCQLALEHNLNQVREVSLEAAGLVQWLDQVELQLFSSKSMWNPSEASKDKLAVLLAVMGNLTWVGLVVGQELCEEMESKQQTYQQVQEKLQLLLAACHPNGASMAERSLRVLERKWGGLTSHLQEQKKQLLQSPNMATEFHATLQELLQWIKQTEEALAALPLPSYILDTVSKQRQQQQALAQETETQRKKLAEMEAGAACLTQDNGDPCSQMGSTKEWLAKVLQQVSKSGEVLEEAHQQAKQEFQSRLWAKRPILEAALQQGGLLRGKALLPADGQELHAMQKELKEHWTALCSWAAERPQKLEEHLLFSGCFGDALQRLLDWLCRAEPQLAKETPVAGDRDLVGTLMEQHKAFQTELGWRAVNVRRLRCSARVLEQGGSSVNTRWLQIQMEELEDHWELIGRLSVSQQNRLEVALRQAKEFHRLLCAFLSRLSSLEKSVMDGATLEEEDADAAMARGQSQLEEVQQSVQCQQLELDCIRSVGEEIVSTCHPSAMGTVQSWVTLAKTRFQQLCSQVQEQEQQLQAQAASLAADQEEAERLSAWITAAEEALRLRDQEPLPEDAGQLEKLGCQHTVFMRELDHKQSEVEKVAKSSRQKRTAQLGLTASSCKRSSGWHGASRSLPHPSFVPLEDLEPQNPLLAQLVHRWQCLWLAAQDRQHRLQSSQQRLQELEEMTGFDFAVWRKRYLQWISHRKSRVLDIFRSIDRDQDGRITQKEFVGHVLASKFPTSLPEMKAVAKIFDVNRDGFIDYYEFISALHPSRDILHRVANMEHIQEEVKRQVAECNCVKRFQVEQISATHYRFGECQQLRMVRILRSTLMVRVGGGWTALDEFLVKNDPCRVKGRTNLKINERYLSPGLLGRKGAGSQSAPASKIISPSCSTSSLSLYSSASAPSSPVLRKTLLRQARSRDRCLHSCSPAGATREAELAFAAGAAGPDAEPSAGLLSSPTGPVIRLRV
ncbi:microtubule-actin cross-linking factor 1, isoforms 6/7-like [Ahaetulla prasina]|uniref:microtubule-actin cross-linking factor 1, isoforms 6/7-like n=1 Tax=Ahaetulla prasina TaxID=499056 RepID=UPI00264765BD|nr:microtubule-actin cross-linking factor 1, isoforms 6/7-like [Ahaetulla prasina]